MTEHNTEDRVVSSSINQGIPADLVAMTDEELLLEYRMTGGSACFETLVKRYERELYNYLRRFLNNQVLAEDAFQATFMQVHLKCQLFDADRKVRPWLYTALGLVVVSVLTMKQHFLLDALSGFAVALAAGRLAQVPFRSASA